MGADSTDRQEEGFATETRFVCEKKKKKKRRKENGVALGICLLNALNAEAPVFQHFLKGP